MGREELAEEREVLESIFPEEITIISDEELRISVQLDVIDDDDEEGAERPEIVLHVRFPEAYPDTEPILDLSAPQHAAPYKFFSVADDKDALLRGLQEVMEENIGVAMVFSLVSTMKENAEQLVADRKAAARKAQEEVIHAAEREENKKFHGTPVTPESFTAWREGFMKEMAELRQKEEDERLAELKKAKVKDPVKLTGRQLWESGLVGKVDEGEGEEDDVPVEDVEKLKVSA